MKIEIIKTEKQYEQALELADVLFDKKLKKNSALGKQLELLLLVIKDYEDRHYPITTPDPIEAVKLAMEEKGLKAKDLTKWLGSKGYVSQILNKKKPLTADIMRIFNKHLGIPPNILLGA